MATGNRRAFLLQTGLGAAGAVAASQGRAAAGEERIVMGAIGCGGQGTGLASSFAAMKGVEVAYVCDPDEARAQRAAEIVQKNGGKPPRIVADLRRILDDKSVQAVSVGTPDHWHAPASLLALAAGKHVYVEKPCSHNVREGRLLVEAAAYNKKVVQHGTQSRSSGLITQAVHLLRKGIIGQVIVAKAWNVQKRRNIGHAQPGKAPEGFDYDLWLGPAPHVPFQANRHHYTWHWWYDFGTGDMGNDGVHEIDIARWGLGVETHPSTISAFGGKYFFDDDQQFPDTQHVVFDYPGDGKIGRKKQLVYEMRLWSRYGNDGLDNLNTFYGTEGWMLLSKRGVLRVYGPDNKPIQVKEEAPRMMGHREDFIDAIRRGRQPNAPIDIGHLSSSLCHLGNIATRVGRPLRFDPQKEIVQGDEEANRLLSRTYRKGHWAAPRGV